MGLDTRVHVTCDLKCTGASTHFPDATKASKAGWVELVFENSHLDHDYIHRWICPDCADKIVKKVKRVEALKEKGSL